MELFALYVFTVNKNWAAVFALGPGVLTRVLLNSGVQKVVALEGNKVFLPELQVIEGLFLHSEKNNSS